MQKPKAVLASSEDSSRVTVGATHDTGDREIGAEWELLYGGRRARRDTAGNYKRNGDDNAGDFQPVDRRGHLHDQRWSRHGGARGGADRANVRIQRSRIQINAAVQLPCKKDASEEERHEEKPL